MTRAGPAVYLTLAAALCASPATAHDGHSAYNAPGHVWRLVELDGAPFPALATLSFPATGRIEGQAPCNRYFGEMWQVYPWFRAEKIASTRRACPDLGLEQAFLEALGRMTLAEASEELLILTDDARGVMIFRKHAQPRD